MKIITVLAFICAVAVNLQAQKEPPNNDQKLRDSAAAQQTGQHHATSSHLSLQAQE